MLVQASHVLTGKFSWLRQCRQDPCLLQAQLMEACLSWNNCIRTRRMHTYSNVTSGCRRGLQQPGCLLFEDLGSKGEKLGRKRVSVCGMG